MSNGRRYTQSKKGALFGALRTGNTEALRGVLKGLSVEEINKLSLLNTAVTLNEIDCLRVLIEAGADVNMQSNIMSTPLYTAVSLNNIACLRVLIEKGANPNQILTYPEVDLRTTALHLAVVKGHIECIKVLLEAGATHDIKDHFGRTALYWSKEIKMDNEVVDLLEKATNIRAKDNAGPEELEARVAEGADAGAGAGRGEDIGPEELEEVSVEATEAREEARVASTAEAREEARVINAGAGGDAGAGARATDTEDGRFVDLVGDDLRDQVNEALAGDGARVKTHTARETPRSRKGGTRGL